MDADDTHLNQSFPLIYMNQTLTEFEKDIETLFYISIRHSLHLNPKKIVVLVFGLQNIFTPLF